MSEALGQVDWDHTLANMDIEETWNSIKEKLN